MFYSFLMYMPFDNDGFSFICHIHPSLLLFFSCRFPPAPTSTYPTYITPLRLEPVGSGLHRHQADQAVRPSPYLVLDVLDPVRYP